MKRIITMSLCAFLLMSCKKNNSDNEPVAFRLLTRTPEFLGNTSYMLKGSIVAENKLEITEAGFIYAGSSTNSTVLLDYNSTATTRVPVLKGGRSFNVNFQIQKLLVSKLFYNVGTYILIKDKTTNSDIIYTGQQTQFQVP